MKNKELHYCEKCEEAKLFEEVNRELHGVLTGYDGDRPYEYKSSVVEFECPTCKSKYDVFIEERIN